MLKKTSVFILILILCVCINVTTISAAGLQGMMPSYTSGTLSGAKPNTETVITNPGNLLGTASPHNDADKKSESAKSESAPIIITNIAGFLGGKDADDVVIEEKESDIVPEKEKPSISNKPLILTYHRISAVEKPNAFTITPEMFEDDIKKLAEMGYTFGTADDLKNYSEDDQQKKLVVITFDDGYESDYTIAMPILEKYNACATFFIIGSNIGAKEYMSREQVKALSLSKSAQIGNHSYEIHHLSFDEVFKIYKEEHDKIIYDFKKNRAILEKITGKSITAYSFPYGIYNRQVAAKLKYYGVTPFTSVENIDMVAPYGRFNRPYDLTLEEVIKRAQKTGK